MALMARSIEMYFSLSRLRRTLKSISIWLPLVPGLVVRCAPAAELDLYLAGTQARLAKLQPLPADLQDHPIWPGHDDPALYRVRVPRRPGGQRDAHQAALGPAPVALCRERPVPPGRADLQGVRGLPHDPRTVELRGQRAGQDSDVVQARAAVGVHHDPEQAPPARGRYPHRLEVQAGRTDYRLEHLGQPRGLGGAVRAPGRTAGGTPGRTPGWARA